MEEEKIISGYCRQLDDHRMVTVLRANGILTEVGKQITEFAGTEIGA